jgi:hypothetical protein
VRGFGVCNIRYIYNEDNNMFVFATTEKKTIIKVCQKNNNKRRKRHNWQSVPTAPQNFVRCIYA